jgi:hypothetical protein
VEESLAFHKAPPQGWTSAAATEPRISPIINDLADRFWRLHHTQYEKETAKMPKAEVGSTKYIANRMKSRGLQRLRWYCQL